MGTQFMQDCVTGTVGIFFFKSKVKHLKMVFRKALCKIGDCTKNQVQLEIAAVA